MKTYLSILILLMFTDPIVSSQLLINFKLGSSWTNYDIYDMYGALTYTICMYVNIGVKRSVRTSGMQPTILHSYKNVFRAKNWNILFPDLSFVFFRISFVYFAWLSNIQLNFLLVSNVIYSNGKTCLRNNNNNFLKIWSTLGGGGVFQMIMLVHKLGGGESRRGPKLIMRYLNSP